MTNSLVYIDSLLRSFVINLNSCHVVYFIGLVIFTGCFHKLHVFFCPFHLIAYFKYSHFLC